MGWVRRTASVGVVAWLAIPLTACAPRTSEAAVGVAVDRAGNPVIVLQNCRADIIQLELSDETQPQTQVLYANEHPLQEVVQIPLSAGTDGWRPDRPVPKLRPDGKFVVDAWGEDRAWLGRGTEFTLADLKALKPGQVRHDWLRRDQVPSYGASPAASQYRITSLDDFITDDCP